MSPTTTRMSGTDRRELVLAAAMRAFAVGGYAGTSTDTVAREAGVSQPYVVRIFGSKLELFLEVFEHATLRIDAAFRAVLEEAPFDPENEDDWSRLGIAYSELLEDREMLQVMMHGFSAGVVPEIAARSRDCMGRIYSTITSTGCTDERAMEFVAHGMLLNVMLSMRAPEHLDDAPELAPLTRCAFGEAMEKLLPHGR